MSPNKNLNLSKSESVQVASKRTGSVEAEESSPKELPSLDDEVCSISNSNDVNIRMFHKKKMKPRTTYRNVPVNKLNSDFSPIKETESYVEQSPDKVDPDILNNKRYNISDNRNSYGTFDTEDKMDEFEDSLIDIKEMSNEVKSEMPNHEKEYSKMDNIIAESESNTFLEISTDSKEIIDDSFASKIAEGNILSTLQERSVARIDIIKEKYKHKNYPKPILSKRILLRRIEKYLDIVSKILKSKIVPSKFYQLAKDQRIKSSQETITAREKWQIDWCKFFGGYYGFKRQLFIASIIVSRCKKDLKNAAKRNDTVSYWTTNGFTTYVLANEIIIRFAMEDFNCNFDKAESIILESAEYGTVVADSIDLIDDLQVGELLQEESKDFMKDVININNKRERDGDQSVEPQLVNSEPNRKKVKNDLLDQILDSFECEDEDEDEDEDA